VAKIWIGRWISFLRRWKEIGSKPSPKRKRRMKINKRKRIKSA